MKVYTRKGDDGTTGLLFGGRAPKDGPGPAAYGVVDEAQSALGLARAEARGTELDELLVRAQRDLVVLMAELATAPENRHKLVDGQTRVTASMVENMEPIIDEVTTRFEPLRDFVIPGENRVAAALDFARTVVRRAERETVSAANQGWLETDSFAIPYLNRLADLVYTFARWQEGEHRLAKPAPINISEEPS